MSIKQLYRAPYNRIYPLKALIRYTEWKLIRLFKVKNYVRKLWGDRKMILHFDSFQSMWIMYNYWVDWEEFNAIKNCLTKSSVFFDVGANMGFYTIWASRFLSEGGQIHAFEPNDRNFIRLQSNINLNNIPAKVISNKIALGLQKGSIQFTQNLDGENHLVTDSNGMELNKNVVMVDVISLDQYCEENNIDTIDYLKIDVEGFELTVLKGAIKLLTNGKIKIIQLEINETLKNSGNTSEELVEFLSNYDYLSCGYNVNKSFFYDLNVESGRENYFFRKGNLKHGS